MSLFGTDGIRGRWGQPPLTPEVARGLGQAVRRRFGAGPVLLARDTRESGVELRDELAGGLGGDVVDLGVLPTPGLSAILEARRGAAGVVITASHNPWQDNGLKVVDGGGHKLDLATEQELEAEILKGTFGFTPTLELQERPGEDLYVELLLERLPPRLDLSGVAVSLEKKHGAAFRTAPRVLEALGARVHAIGVEPDGRNINEGLGAVHPGELSRHCLRVGARLGVCLDGDADRCILVGPGGRIVDGDALLLLLAREPGVVGTVMCNAALERRLGERGLGFVRTQVGDRNVAEVMGRNGWPVGGEPSGHVLLADGFPTGDGLFTALRVLADGLDLRERLRDWRPDPSALVNVRVASKPPLEELGALQRAIGEARAGGASRVLLRYSGTEAKLRVLVEAPHLEDARGFADALAAAAAEAIEVHT